MVDALGQRQTAEEPENGAVHCNNKPDKVKEPVDETRDTTAADVHGWLHPRAYRRLRSTWY